MKIFARTIPFGDPNLFQANLILETLAEEINAVNGKIIEIQFSPTKYICPFDAPTYACEASIVVKVDETTNDRPITMSIGEYEYIEDAKLDAHKILNCTGSIIPFSRVKNWVSLFVAEYLK